MKRISMKNILLLFVCLLLVGAPIMARGTAQAAVTPISVRLSDDAITIDMAYAKRASLSAAVLPEGASQRVTWATSNRRVAKVSSSGVVTAVARGTATITATARGTRNVLATCVVTVKNSNLPDGISLGLTAISMERFSTRQLTAQVWPDTANKSVAWKSSNRSIATVDKNGLITAQKAGTAIVTCYSTKDKSVAATVQVNVFAKSSPTTITLSPADDVMEVGQTLQLSAATSPSDACHYYTWKSSSTRTATVSENGLVTAHRTGWVTVSCTSRQNTRIKATRKILVVSKDSPRSLSLGLTSVTMNPGDTRALAVTVSPADKSSAVTWKSSKSSVVAVSANGTLTAKKAGTATVTCTSRVNSNLKTTLEVRVENLPAPSSLSITGASAVAKGGTIQLTAVASPAKTSAEVSWSSSDRHVAKVSDSGVVTGVKGGVATITATSKRNRNVRASFSVTVSDPNSPTHITLNTASFSLEAGATFDLEPTVLPEDSAQGVRYTSSNTAVARVDSKGVITGRNTGTAVITARSSYNSSISAAIQVTVVNRAAPTAVTLTASTTWLEKGGTATLTATPTPASASRLFKFTSSSSSIASVSADGVVTGKKVGTVKITATSKKNSRVRAEITLVVADASTPRTLALNTTETFLGEQDTITLSPIVTPETASRRVSWSSSNRAVATVSPDGTVRGIKAGTATISCTTAAGNLTATCVVTVYDTSLTRVVPARTTNIAGISANMAKIEAVRRSAVNQVVILQRTGRITSGEAALRREIVDRAFEMQAFPWMTLHTQEYWTKAYAYKRYLPGNVYYGLPYIQTASSGSYQNRRYNVAKALSEGRYYSSGKGYYLLNQEKLLEGMYVGNDCSAFASISMFGLDHVASFLNTTAIAKSNYYATLSSYADLRPGDILIRSGEHVVVFLYYTNTAKTEMMIIEQGGDGSTVICSLYNPNWFASRGYVPRRRTGFKMN